MCEFKRPPIVGLCFASTSKQDASKSRIRPISFFRRSTESFASNLKICFLTVPASLRYPLNRGTISSSLSFSPTMGQKSNFLLVLALNMELQLRLSMHFMKFAKLNLPSLISSPVSSSICCNFEIASASTRSFTLTLSNGVSKSIAKGSYRKLLAADLVNGMLSF